jgi:broad specificity phosphatase PhoE
MNGPQSVWLIRHGETEWSRSGAHTGRTDIPLIAAGVKRAEATGRYLAGRPFALVLTSPLKRARDTCRIAGYGAVAQVEPNLCEWDYGAYEGRTTADIRHEVPNWSLWTMGVPQGETVEQVAERARLVLERVSAVSGEVALFAHGHILRILTACWLDLPPDAGRLFALDTGCLSVLSYEHEIRVIQRWNLSPEV